MSENQPQGERVVVGELHRFSPVLARITAPNPGMMTGPGTNTWIVGGQDKVVVDPGPDDAEHLDAVVAAGGGRIRAILITHAHPDHSPGARRLQEITGASVMAHPTDLQGIRDQALAADQDLDEGDRLDGDDFTLHCLHAPGHAADHLCFLLENERILLAGDVVMDSNTVVISPPDGDMQQYLETLARLRDMEIDAIAPGHGRMLRPARDVFQAIIDHRLERERMVLDALAAGDALINDMVARIYTHVPEPLQRVARGSVQAHLEKLRAEGRVSGAGQGPWALAG